MTLKPASFKRQIGLPGLIFIGVGSILGSGWLFGSFFSAQFAGPSAIFAWVIAALIAFMIALPLAEIGTMFPISGSFIHTAYLTHGRLVGFLLSVLAWLGMASVAPIEAQGVLLYIGNYVPALLVKQQQIYALSHLGNLCGIGLLFLFTSINFFTIRLISECNTIITSWKLIIPLLTIIVFCCVSFHPHNFTNHGFWVNSPHGIPQALIAGGAIYSFLGFRQVIAVAGEVKHPARHIPIALFVSLLITALLYVLLQFIFITSVKPEWLNHGWAQLNYPHDKGPLAGMAQNFGLLWLAIILYIDSIISPSGTGIVFTTSTSRVVYRIAERKEIPDFFTHLNGFHAPVFALMLNFAFGILFLQFFSGWQAMASFIVLCTILGYAISPLNLMALRAQQPDLKRPFRLAFAPLITCLAFILCNGIAYLAGWVLFKALLIMLLMILIVFSLNQIRTHRLQKADWKHGSWFVLYLIGMAVLSYLGKYGEGRQWLPHGLDLVCVAAWSVFIYWLAWYNRLK